MRTNRAGKLVNLYTQNQFLSTIRNNERASYNGSIEASQASDVGSIPIARSRKLTQRLHFPFFPNPPKPVPFFRETSVALSRSNLVSVANKRVKQIFRRSEPWSSQDQKPARLQI